MTLSDLIVAVVQFTLRTLYNLPLIGYYFDLWSLTVTSVCRFMSGHWVASNLNNCRRPKKLLKLYNYEGCPFCKKIREALCVLDLDCIIYPCPRETFTTSGFVKDSRYRKKAKEIGGKAQFPFLIDENENVKMYESDQIIAYLWKMYGNKTLGKPPTYILGSTQLSFFVYFCCAILRPFPEHGLLRMPSNKPEKLLELWSFEPSPFCKKVREVLTCLEIPYILRNAARGSMKRDEFRNRFGKKLSFQRKAIGLIQLPLLVDANTKTEMVESENIKQYLIDTYKTGNFDENERVNDYFIRRHLNYFNL